MSFCPHDVSIGVPLFCCISQIVTRLRIPVLWLTLRLRFPGFPVSGFRFSVSGIQLSQSQSTRRYFTLLHIAIPVRLRVPVLFCVLTVGLRFSGFRFSDSTVSGIQLGRRIDRQIFHFVAHRNEIRYTGVWIYGRFTGFRFCGSPVLRFYGFWHSAESTNR
jgi:hypothetical protein